MAERRNAEMGFVDGILTELGGTRTKLLLDKLDNAVDWNRIAKPILKLPEYKKHNHGGRPAWSPDIMLKCLLLAKWFNLSDPGLEDALKDRISFRQFIGLSFTDATPDETTFVRFRTRLREAGLEDVIFKSVLNHMEEQGLLVREGTMIDATIIEQSTGRKNDDGENTRDDDASFTKKHGKTYHGYKGHIAVDLTGIVTDYRFSTAKHHDSRYIDELTSTECHAVIADSAYSDRERRRELRSRNVIDGIIYRRTRGQSELYDWQDKWNKLVSRIRARVEHPFAMMKSQLGYRCVRYRGLRRNTFDFCMTVIACNIKRSLSLRVGDRPLHAMQSL